MAEDLKHFEENAPRSNVYNGVHHALTLGMYISTPLFALGVVLALLHPAGRLMTSAELTAYYHPAYLFSRLAHLDAEAVLMLGTIAMILTPISRVIVSLVAFAIDGDRRFVLVTAVVLVTIALAIVLGILGIA